MQLIIAISLLASLSVVASTDIGIGIERQSMVEPMPKDLVRAEWEEFKIINNKVYHDVEEDNRRFKIYLKNRQRASKHNLEQVLGLHAYRQKVNKFADMEFDEFVDTFTGFKPKMMIDKPGMELTLDRSMMNITSLPHSVDLRKKNIVTEVKDQGRCNSAWAFATIGALEGAHAIKTGKLVSLSEQQLVDCSKNGQNRGCKGGSIEDANQYIIDNGVSTDLLYPYRAQDDTCKIDHSNIVVRQSRFMNLPEGDEIALMHTIANIGPVSASIYVTPSLQLYRGGIFHDTECSSRRNDLNHNVLVVGYGTDRHHGKFWIIKNSWAKDFGEKGYFKLARNSMNMCGISTAATYPILG